MKMKRFLSLLLALVMSFALAAPAFAAEPDDGDGDPNEGIMLLSLLYEDDKAYAATGTYRSDNFTSTPGNGGFIKVWFANRTDYDVTVYLYRADKSGYIASQVVKANDYYKDNVIWWEGSDTEPVTYYVRILSTNSHTVSGHLSIAQYPTKG